jgi:hypothetical protein
MSVGLGHGSLNPRGCWGARLAPTRFYMSSMLSVHPDGELELPCLSLGVCLTWARDIMLEPKHII